MARAAMSRPALCKAIRALAQQIRVAHETSSSVDDDLAVIELAATLAMLTQDLLDRIADDNGGVPMT
jgi:hypothetical protein